MTYLLIGYSGYEFDNSTFLSEVLLNKTLNL